MYSRNISRVTFRAWKGQLVVTETSTVQPKNDSSNSPNYQVTHDERTSTIKLHETNKKSSLKRDNGNNKALSTQRKTPCFDVKCKKGQNDSKEKKCHIVQHKSNPKSVRNHKRSTQATKTKSYCSNHWNDELQSKIPKDGRNLSKSSQICSHSGTTHNNNNNALNRHKNAMILARTHLVIKLLTRYFKHWMKEMEEARQKISCVRIILSVYFQPILGGTNLHFFNIILGRYFEFHV